MVRPSRFSGFPFVALFALAALTLGAPPVGAPSAAANHLPYAIGDVFAGVGDGKINRYTNAGLFVEQLNTTGGSNEQTGMCFDGNTPASHLRSTNFSNNNMTRFNNQGGVVAHPWAGPFNQHPESCVVDAAGDVYVGQADGTGDILKFNAAGTLLDSYNVPTGPRGSDWIDLAADQCTMFYTSEGNLIRRYDVCTDTPLANFNPSPLPASPCFALRIRANGEVLVACQTAVLRLSAAGAVIQTYPAPLTEYLFALNLDPNGTSFWTAGYFTKNVFKFDITTGVQLLQFMADDMPPLGPSLAGLAVFGEPIVSQPGGPAQLTLDPKTDTNPVDSQHCVTATVVDAAGNPVANIVVRFSVTGSVNTSGSDTTDADGEADFCYTGPPLPGADAIHAYADTNNNNMQEATEPFDDATKIWVLPVTTPGCEIKITNGGWIIAANLDRASFGGNAKADEDGNVTGNEEYQDHGPAEPFNLHGDVLVVVCNSSTSATIFGDATIDGSGSNTYRIDVQDLGEPGKGVDHYRMRVNAYDSGDQILKGGNVQIHMS
jgi:hypothetical protein